jgi:predicted ester cyclase
MSIELVQENKKLVWDFWQDLNGTGADRIADVVRAYVHADAVWHGPHPINDLEGVEALLEGFWQPLFWSIPDLRRHTDIFIGGYVHWVGAIGHLSGTFSHDWLGIPATGGQVHIRFGEFNAVDDGKIILTYIILDLLDLIRQAGYQLLPPSLGEEGLWPGPMTGEGVLLEAQDEGDGPSTLQMAKTMCRALATPRLRDYWDPEKMMWYGPSGIGTTRALRGFVDNHQTPFRHAFPAYGRAFSGVHAAEVSEGDYAGWVGWPSIRATHSGEYLGIPPSGRVVDMRVMDFYRREGDLIIENWVPIDMIHLLLQMGLDLFEELQSQLG